jgi:ABC-type phosphate transport system permease subunit
LSALIELGLLLFIISVIVNASARLLLWTVFRPMED